MNPGQRLSERLESLKGFEQDDHNCKKFVTDHKKYLKRLSPVGEWRPERLVKYRYRPHDFYMKECNGEYSMVWIFMLVNDIRDPAAFNESCNKIYLVPPEEISKLYNIYSTSANRDRD